MRNPNLLIRSEITPTDIKVYIENNVPYLDYSGECTLSDGTKYKIHFPKISLTFSSFKQDMYDEYDFYHGTRKIMPSFNVLVSNDRYVEYEVIEREVTKEQLEKELGYKINIKE